MIFILKDHEWNRLHNLMHPGPGGQVIMEVRGEAGDAEIIVYDVAHPSFTISLSRGMDNSGPCSIDPASTG
jgi:hypothetical protein